MKNLVVRHLESSWWPRLACALDHERVLSTSSRSAWVALLCVGVTGCAALPAVGVGLAAQGAQGLVALTLGPLADAQERSGMNRCELSAARGVSVGESLEAMVPAGDGEVATFEPAYWRLELAREGYPNVERSRTPTEGTLAVTERSVVFVPPPGATSVRIPYELVEEVEVKRNAANGEAVSMIVRSCFGRFDIVTFRQPESRRADPALTNAAAIRLAARVSTFQSKASD